MRNKISKFLATAVIVLLGVGSTACSSQTENKAANGKLNVVATTTQMQDFVKEIAGDKINLTGLLKPGASAHHFDPSPADLQTLGAADMLIMNGADLETFMDSPIEASGFKGEIVYASEAIDIDRAKTETAAYAKQRAEAAASNQDQDLAEASEHGEDAEINPHTWTSIEFAADMVDYIAQELAAQDADNADFYKENSQKYIENLQLVNDWAQNQFAKVVAEDKKFVSTHNALLYFLNDYDIHYVGSVIPSFEDNAEPSAAEINKLVENIKTQQVPAVFIESSSSDRLNRTVANEAGVPVVTDPIYADSLGAEAPADTYIGATIANIKTMLTAWGYDIEQLPEQLAQYTD